MDWYIECFHENLSLSYIIWNGACACVPPFPLPQIKVLVMCKRIGSILCICESWKSVGIFIIFLLEISCWSISAHYTGWIESRYCRFLPSVSTCSFEMNGLNHCVGMVMRSLKYTYILFCCAAGGKWPEAVWLPGRWAGRIDAACSDNPYVPELEWAVSLLVAACTGSCNQSLCPTVRAAAGILSGVCFLICWCMQLWAFIAFE